MLKDFVKKVYTPEEQTILLEEERKRAFLEEAGLEGMEADKLRKQFLPSDEAIAAKAEELESVRIKKSRKKDWDEFIDAKRRMGRVLHHSEIISKLKTVIPSLYATDARQANRISLVYWNPCKKFGNRIDNNERVGGVEYLAWIHYGYNPEYEIDIVNDVGIAIGQKRGWRTLLTRLICRRDEETFTPCSLLTEEQALELFGPPTQGETASYYRQHLYKFRNTSPERARMEWEIMMAAQKFRYA